jgi:hypothetical protein
VNTHRNLNFVQLPKLVNDPSVDRRTRIIAWKSKNRSLKTPPLCVLFDHGKQAARRAAAPAAWGYWQRIRRARRGVSRSAAARRPGSCVGLVDRHVSPEPLIGLPHCVAAVRPLAAGG